MSLLKLWFIRNPVLVSYSICMRQGSSNLSGSQSALTCLCVCARAQLGLREFNTNIMIKQGRGKSMQDTVDAIAQLATATASDRGTVATLTTTNAKLATQLEAAHAQIDQLKNEIATLKNKIKPAWQGQRPVKTKNNDSYCWSHGYKVAKSHTSATCNMKKSGHQDASNKSNTMGGFQWGKE
jgi:hypothetical protein